ncbi:MAG: LysR family transcriptional regulator [Bacteroidales bacterium]|nr:LysR family transcriptional regulator [Bacteroidales bacterium]MBQ6082249.1 LysR family transcriptional regulator [Bacteroidales bacterium]MBQ7457967.1 LysR family transcriptional regulator [Bacteroidales bacterium]
MTDKRLLVFTILARTLSFSETARQTGISQPAVSKHIAALESEIGAALFVRYGRTVALTEKGLALLQIAEKILDGYAQIEIIKE